MSTDLESRLHRLLGGQSSTGDAEERALRRAVAALPTPARSRRRLRTVALALAAVVGVMTIAAGALAAAGALHVSLGRTPAASSRHAALSRLELEPGTNGVAAVIDGNLWLTTRGGMRIEGLPVSSAELSPHARYVGVGIGGELVVMAPDGHRAWARSTRGAVVAISWAPSGLLLAYVVHTGHGFQLRRIEGDGDHDLLVDSLVRPVRPSWRGDSLALAYVAAGGRAVVYDFSHRSRRVVSPASPVDAVSFAPDGRTLAIVKHGGTVVLTVGGRRQPQVVGARNGTPVAIAWSRHAHAVATRVLQRLPAGARVSYFVVR